MPEKILVVDDDSDSLKLISLMLKRQGYEVLAANAGTAALQRAYSDQPDLIILDVMMPDMDGYEVCRRLRGEPKTSEIPIIMFTAKTLVDDKVAGFEAGADDYLTKPTHPAELTSRVKAVLVRRQQQRSGPNATTPQPDAPPVGMSFAFIGAKGGVGTSTLAANVGTLLAKENSTILTDLRPGQGSLGASLGLVDNRGITNIFSQTHNAINTSLVDQQMVRHSSGMGVLMSSLNPQESQINLSVESVGALARALGQLGHYRLYDLGSGLNRATVRLLREMDRVVLVTEPNPIAVALAQHILQELDHIGIPKAIIALVLFNRSQANNQMPWQDVEALLKHEVSAIVSPAPDLAYQAAENGVTLVQSQPSSIVAGQLSKLVEELVKSVV